MKTIINYIKSCFCRHDWKCLSEIEIYDGYHTTPTGHKWIYLCKKCMQKKVIKS